MNEAALRNLDRAVMWAFVAISLVPLLPYAAKSLLG